MSFHEPGYTEGEAAAFLGPLTGVDPDRVAAWAVVVVSEDDDGMTFRIAASDEDKRETVRMLAAAIIELSSGPEDEP